MYKQFSRYIQHQRERSISERRPSQHTQLDQLIHPKRNSKRSPKSDLDRIRLALERQEILTGHVTRVESYGVFVKLGTVEGLIHIRRLTTVLRIGQSVQVCVRSVASNNTRVTLSMLPAPPQNTSRLT